MYPWKQVQAGLLIHFYKPNLALVTKNKIGVYSQDSSLKQYTTNHFWQLFSIRFSSRSVMGPYLPVLLRLLVWLWIGNDLKHLDYFRSWMQRGDASFDRRQLDEMWFPCRVGSSACLIWVRELFLSLSTNHLLMGLCIGQKRDNCSWMPHISITQSLTFGLLDSSFIYLLNPALLFL